MIEDLVKKATEYLVWWSLQKESSNLFRFLAWDGQEIWMIEEEELADCIEKAVIRLGDYENVKVGPLKPTGAVSGLGNHSE